MKNRHQLIKALIIMVLANSSLFAPIWVNAQQSSSIAIEEITVTASKREESLQDTPIAVTAYTQNDMDRQNIINVVDLSQTTPGLTINKNEGARVIATIRGVGFEANQNAQAVAGVALHTDGVFLPEAVSLMTALLDVERIEVLRGPQGTVFGQNSTGGALNIISKRPVLGEFGGKVDMTTGNYSLIRPRLIANIPVGETAALRVAGEYYGRDGYSEIVNTGIAGFELDETDDYSGRASFLWEARDDLSFLIRGQHYEYSGADAAERNILDPSGDKRKITQNFASVVKRDQTLVSGEIVWDTPWAEVKSISAYSDTQAQGASDNDQGDGSFLGCCGTEFVITNQFRKTTAFTQEINISSNSDDSPIEWLVGAFYLTQDSDSVFIEFRDINFDGTANLGPVAGRDDFFVTRDTLFAGGNELSFSNFTPSERESLSFFGQATWSVTDDWRLIGGIRYTDETARANVLTTFAAAPTPVKSTLEKVTWKAGVQYDISDDVMGYFTASTGVKPGGINLAGSPGTLVDLTFGPETVLSYELGLKGRFADGRVQINAAAFYYDYEDLQFQSENFAPFQGGVVNTPSVEIYGAEAEIVGVLTDNLRLDLNVAWLEGEIKDSFLVLPPVAAQQANRDTFAGGQGLFSPLNFTLRAAGVRDIQGNRPAKLPSLSFGASLTHDHEFANLGRLTSNISYVYKGAHDAAMFNDPGLGNPQYDLINVHFRFEPQNYENWYGEFSVQNLENDDAVSGRWTNAFGSGATTEQFLPPRLFLVRVGYEF